MAQTPAERKKKERERRKTELIAMSDEAYPHLSEPFSQWLERTEGYGDWSSATFHLDAIGLQHPEFPDDRGPDWMDYGETEHPDDYHPYAGYKASIGRAEAFVDHMIAAATNMAFVINRYKREQLAAKVRELEAADLTDPEARKQAFDDMVRIRKMLEQLEKMTRVTFHEWHLKGV